jgi:hypothetical protein
MGQPRDKLAEQLPVADAGPGYLVQPVGVTTTLVRLFPEGVKVLDTGQAARFSDSASRCVVTGVVFTPPGRQVRSLDRVTVARAVDDKGRPVAQQGSGGEGRMTFDSGDRRQKSIRFTVNLALPQADARAVEELQGELLVTTYAGWKTHRVTDLAESLDRPIDLGDVLPGATLVVRRVRQKRSDKESGGLRQIQGYVGIEVTGPETVAWLDYKTERPGAEHHYSYESRSSTRRDGDKVTKRVALRTSGRLGAAQDPPPLVLVIRFPEGMKRERVKFTMTAMDLY